MPRIPFEPTPDQLTSLTDALASPDLALREIAARHHTTLDALNLYLASDPALAHIATLELAAAVRTRLAATSHLHRAVATLTELLDDYSLARSASGNADRNHAPSRATSTAATNAPVPALTTADSPPPIPDPSLAERQRDRARRAAYLLFRLATFTPRPLAGLRAPASQAAAPPTAAPASHHAPNNGHAAAHRPTQPSATRTADAPVPRPIPTAPRAPISTVHFPRSTVPNPRRPARDLVATAGRAP